MIQSVLIIDEDVTNIFLSRAIMKIVAPEKAVQYCDNAASLEYLINCFHKSKFPDLVLAGFNMPMEYQKDYLQALSEFKNHSEIVGMSVLFTEKEIELLSEVGIKKFVVRPLSVGKIKEIIR